MQEKVVVTEKVHRNKRQNFKKEEKKNGDKPYGNTYGRKGQANTVSIITNEELRASMWT